MIKITNTIMNTNMITITITITITNTIMNTDKIHEKQIGIGGAIVIRFQRFGRPT
jgi:hypothetical protein